MSIKALIAVRSGSKRVENKNIRKFGNTNLLELKIKQLQRMNVLDGIIVNSNDDVMLEIANSLGAEVVKRDEIYASNSISMSEVYKNMAENFNGDIIVYSNVTNPLLKDETFYNAINIFKNNVDEFDSLNTGHLIKEFLFKDNAPINYDLKNQPRSQDLPDIYAINFAISIISKENMIKYKNVVGLNPCIYGIDYYEATDIDNQIDFDFAEYMYCREKGLL